MKYQNVAFGYVLHAGLLRLEWSNEGSVRATRVFTGQTTENCQACREGAWWGPHDADPQALLEALVYCNDGDLFGQAVELEPEHCIWGTESMYRRARHGGDLGLGPDGLLELLCRGSLWYWWQIKVENLEGPTYWQAELRAEGPRWDWLGPVTVDAGDVRLMLRTASALMPADCRAASAVVDLMQLSKQRTAAIVRELDHDHADLILQYAVFGRVIHGR
ncbi:hypothetical protein [Streptomyces rimosus]|uniref:hypothetical protein n=1 Tax=Streptomyces rimosus TaxID=1927 RepID=UPI0004BE4F44|nr:hypothetical protein [Streptomyces rimosus]